MAKLNVVIPAVEVTVGGVTYRKVDRKAQAGDIVKALVDEEDITGGAFYAVRDERGSYTFYDNENDSRPVTLRNCPELFEVYAPISEPAAQPSASETITFEGATWRKVDRDVREGDAIKFTDEGRFSYLQDSKLYVVNRVDGCGDPHITDDDEDSYDAGSEDFEVYEKVTDSAAAEYREVNRKAEVGEKIRVTNVHLSDEEFSEGDVLTVSRVDGDGDIWYAEEVDIDGIIFYQHREHGNEYVVLEPVTKSAEPTKPERLAVGDYARVVERGHHAFNYGDIVEIIGTDDSSVPYHAKALTNGNSGWASASRLVRATDEEVAAAKDPRSQFAVGDYVKVAVGYCEHNVGDVLKITNTASRHDFYVTNVATSRLGCIDADKLVKLTADETAELERKQAKVIADIERKQAEEKRWAAIGRKVSELKDGDLVRFTEATGAIGFGTGKITEIRNVRGQEFNFGEEFRGLARWCELVTPVEQRFDRAEEVAAA